jgi:hypothetical protein
MSNNQIITNREILMELIWLEVVKATMEEDSSLLNDCCAESEQSKNTGI